MVWVLFTAFSQMLMRSRNKWYSQKMWKVCSFTRKEVPKRWGHWDHGIERKDSLDIWTTGHVCYNLTESLSAFHQGKNAWKVWKYTFHNEVHASILSCRSWMLCFEYKTLPKCLVLGGGLWSNWMPSYWSVTWKGGLFPLALPFILCFLMALG